MAYLRSAGGSTGATGSTVSTGSTASAASVMVVHCSSSSLGVECKGL